MERKDKFSIRRLRDSLPAKLRLLYLPYVSIAGSCLVGYSILNWLLLIKLELFPLSEEVADFWLPCLLPGLPIFIWLRPRLKALQKTKRNRGHLRDLFWFACWFTTAAPTVIAQGYLATSTGKITHLDHIGLIDQMPKTKYYTVQDTFFDQADATAETATHYSGKYSETFNMAVYLACPIQNYGGPSRNNVWLGTVYRNQIGSSNLSNEERASDLRNFYDSTLAAYRGLNLRGFSYLERLGRSNDDRYFEEAAKRNPLYQPGTGNIILVARLGNFADRNGDKLAWIFESLGIGAVVGFLILLAAPIEQKEMHRLSSGGKLTESSHKFSRMVLLPNRDLIVTPILIYINLVVFIWMVLAGLGFASFNAGDLFSWGGNFRAAVWHGEIWRLVTSMFVHGGVMHLIGNLAMLVLVGLLLEIKLGHLRFFLCYFICGIAGGIASIMRHPATVSVGASGAIMGGLGVLIGLTVFERDQPWSQKKGLLTMALFLVGVNLLMGFLIPAVDNADHFGGLIAGLFLGPLFAIFPGALGQRPGRAVQTHRSIFKILRGE